MEPLAQGRVWLGADAKARGLVDELGGLDTALAAIKKKAGIADKDRVRIVAYPPKRTFLEQLMKSSSETASMESQIAKWTGLDIRSLQESGYLRILPFRLGLN
jgi:protease IV